MKYFDLLSVGLIGLARHTHYKDIPVLVASGFMGLIIELNLMAIIGLTSWRPILTKFSILIPFVALLTFLNYKYYNKHKDYLDKLEAEQKEINGPNTSSGQLAAMFVILESALIIPFSMLYTDFN